MKRNTSKDTSSRAGVPPQNLINFESKLQTLQSTINKDELMFKNWNMSNQNHRAKVRNEAATMILKVKTQPQITNLERPRLKKIRYLLDPTTKA